MGRPRLERGELDLWRGEWKGGREGADEIKRQGGLIYEEESTATQGRAENGRVKADGVGGVSRGGGGWVELEVDRRLIKQEQG